MSDNKANQKVAIVTGANTGIGAETAVELAHKGYLVFVACRNEEKTKPVLERIKQETGGDRAEFLKLDLENLAQVRQAAKAFLDRQLPLKLLVNNAGLASPAHALTADGLETTFEVNHLGHFLFTILLLPRIRASAPARIVHVASKVHTSVKDINFDKLRQPATSAFAMDEYALSKLSNILFSNELARRLKDTNITSNSLHPGVVATDIWRSVFAPIRWILKLFLKNVKDGAKTTLHVALSPNVEGVSGKYFDNSKEVAPSRVAQDEQLARKLWKHSIAFANVTADELRAAGFAE